MEPRLPRRPHPRRSMNPFTRLPWLRPGERIVVEVLSTDVLVIGGGAGGANAALKVADQGARVLMVVKGLLGKSGCSVFASHLPYHDVSTTEKSRDRLRTRQDMTPRCRAGSETDPVTRLSDWSGRNRGFAAGRRRAPPPISTWDRPRNHAVGFQGMHVPGRQAEERRRKSKSFDAVVPANSPLLVTT